MPSVLEEEMDQNFKLWYGVLVFVGGVVLISALFLGTVLLCKYHSRRKDIRYIYQTKPMKSEAKTLGIILYSYQRLLGCTPGLTPCLLGVACNMVEKVIFWPISGL